MARARNIKPGLFENEVLGEIDPLITLLFIGLWTISDRDGFLEDRPKRIKANIFPYREGLDINDALTVLASLEFIQRFDVEDMPVIYIPTFKCHQSPHKTERASKIKEKIIETGGCDETGKLTFIVPLTDGYCTLRNMNHECMNHEGGMMNDDSPEPESSTPEDLSSTRNKGVPEILDVMCKEFKLERHHYGANWQMDIYREWLEKGYTLAVLRTALLKSNDQGKNRPHVNYLGSIMKSEMEEGKESVKKSAPHKDFAEKDYAGEAGPFKNVVGGD